MADNASEAYAVVRLDLYQEPLTAQTLRDNPDIFVRVKEVVPTLEEAQAEVERLNALHPDEGTLYFWQGTRLFPEGRNAQRGY